ncbi:MAG TPA: hypothetical protein VNR36_01440 [Pseudolysinimonas sp.]|nr:hypothetical protein [Pseudolysinimonas sp.]
MTDTVPEIPAALDTDVFITRVFAAPRDVVWKFGDEREGRRDHRGCRASHPRARPIT